MLVTAFCGSPRQGGNTECMLREILKGAGESGASTMYRSLNDMVIKPCQACGWCKENQKEFCVLKDDMQTVYRDLQDSEAIVIGSPVYMWQMTAQTKIMVDRLYGTLLPGFASKTGPKKLVLVFAQGAEAGSFDSYIQSTAKMFKMLKFDIQDVIVAPCAGEAGSVCESSDLMDKCRETGRLLVT